MMDIRLDQGRTRLAVTSLGQHPIGNVHRDQVGVRVALAQDRDQRASTGADFQYRTALAEKGIIGRQQLMQQQVPIGWLVVIPFNGKFLKELAEVFHLGLVLNRHNFWIITHIFANMRCEKNRLMGDIHRLHV